MKKITRPTCKTCFWWEIDEDNRGIKRGFCHNTKVIERDGGSFCETVSSCWCDEHPDMDAYRSVLANKKPKCIACAHYRRVKNKDYSGKCALTAMRIYDEDDNEACYLHEKVKK